MSLDWTVVPISKPNWKRLPDGIAVVDASRVVAVYETVLPHGRECVCIVCEGDSFHVFLSIDDVLKALGIEVSE